MNGMVIWITGLSGTGKTTIAREVVGLLKKRRPDVLLLDGDEVRRMMGDDLGHNPKDRLANAYRIARLCKFLSDQGSIVVCSTMSLFQECHQWNREHIQNYFEVLLRVPLEILKKRDSKGVYSRGMRDIVGIDIPAQEPAAPDLVIDNSKDRVDFTGLAERIVATVGTKYALGDNDDI